jgi:O-antigen ligase
MVRQMWRRQWARGLGLGALVFLAVLVVFGRSRAASYLLLLLPVIALAVLRYRGPRVAVGACAVLFLAALVTTLLMARFGSPAGTEAAILDPRRILLWRDAWFLAVTNPLTGVGPGGFREESALARLDPDAAWAHHDFLQQGAETGLVGMVLLVGAFLWIYVGLWRGASRDSTSVLGAVSLTALGIHASVDYVLHFPELVLAAAALVGAGMAVQRSGRTREVDRADERRTEAQNERPKAELS